MYQGTIQWIVPRPVVGNEDHLEADRHYHRRIEMRLVIAHYHGRLVEILAMRIIDSDAGSGVSACEHHTAPVHHVVKSVTFRMTRSAEPEFH